MIGNVNQRAARFAALTLMSGIVALGWPAPTVQSEPQPAPKWTGPDFEAIFPPPRNARELKTLQALQKVVAVDFTETRLDAAIKKLLDEADVPFVFDTKALDDAGVGSDTPINLHVRRMPLRTALHLLLSPIDLTWTLDGELLTVTTVDEAGQHLDMRIYDVNDLVCSVHARNEREGLQIVVDLLQSICAPTTWDQVGGPGSIDVFPGRRSVLVIWQTLEVHTEVLRMLARLRYSQGLPLQLELPRELRAASLEPAGAKRYVGAPDPLIDRWQQRRGGER